MPRLTPSFHVEAETLHQEHAVLLDDLSKLEGALRRLENEGREPEEFEPVSDVARYARGLASVLPDHFCREEAELLQTVAEVSPELARFAAEMKGQHADIARLLYGLRRALDLLQVRMDPAGIAHLQACGLELVDELRRHIALEEKELSGFL